MFTGGSLLYGSTGRPDLLGPEHTAALARAQYASAHRLAAELPDSAPVFPTHGFGSFCAATQTDAPVLHDRPREAGQPGAHPRGAQLPGRPCWPAWTPGPPTTPTWPRPTWPGRPAPTCRRRTAPTRPSSAAASRPASGWSTCGTGSRSRRVSCPARSASRSTAASPATWAGLLPWGTPLTLLGETPEQVAQAQRELARIGIDRPAAAASGGPPRMGRRAAAGIAAAGQVRRPGRGPPGQPGGRRAGRAGRAPPAGVGRGATSRAPVHIPLHELPGRLAEVPAGRGVGALPERVPRDRAAASLLAGRGRQVISVDDDFGNAGTAGLPLVQD